MVHVILSNRFVHICWNNFLPRYKQYGVRHTYLSITKSHMITLYYGIGEFMVTLRNYK